MTTAKKKADDQPAEQAQDDPLANFPKDVKGGHWEHDKESGDTRWIADDAEA